MTQWYQKLFKNYAKTYEKECFVKGTTGEVNFIEKELKHNRKTRILDVGCGTGRHSIELAKRGYTVTGLDLSKSMLAQARTKAVRAGVKIRFLQRDARKFSFREKFGMVIMLCEGAFSLMETDAMNYAILKNAANALKPGGKFIFTNLNALFPLYHSVKDFLNDNSNTTNTNKLSFDLMTLREHSTMSMKDDSGKKLILKANERYYMPSEITWMLKSLGFKDIGIYGARLGKFSRRHTLTVNDFEMLVVAIK